MIDNKIAGELLLSIKWDIIKHIYIGSILREKKIVSIKRKIKT